MNHHMGMEAPTFKLHTCMEMVHMDMALSFLSCIIGITGNFFCFDALFIHVAGVGDGIVMMSPCLGHSSKDHGLRPWSHAMERIQVMWHHDHGPD